MAIRYIVPLVIYKIIDPHILPLDGKILRGLFERERFKPATIRTSQGNVTNLPQLKQVIILCHSDRILSYQNRLY